jgi:hypothetical protein
VLDHRPRFASHGYVSRHGSSTAGLVLLPAGCDATRARRRIVGMASHRDVIARGHGACSWGAHEAQDSSCLHRFRGHSVGSPTQVSFLRWLIPSLSGTRVGSFATRTTRTGRRTWPACQANLGGGSPGRLSQADPGQFWRALKVGGPGRSDLCRPGRRAAPVTAVGLPSVAAPTDREHSIATTASLETKQKLVEHRPSAATTTNLPAPSAPSIVCSKAGVLG